MKLNLADYGAFIVLSLVLLQIISYILSSFFPNFPNLNFGFGFLLFIVAIAVLIPFNLIVKRGGSLQKEDILSILILMGVLILIIFLFPKLAPETFQQAIYNLKFQMG